MYEERTLNESKLTKFKEFFTPKNSSWLVFGFLILAGIVIRIFLWDFTSSDIFVWYDAAKLLLSGENPYTTTLESFQIEEGSHFYAYMPLWMYICSLILLIFPDGWFYVIIKILLIILDLIVVGLMYVILRDKVENVWRLKLPIAVWFITPMIVMTSAMHGKFDSLMFIFILAACIFHKKENFILESVFLSLGVLTKTIVLILVPLFFLKNIRKKDYKTIAYKILLIIFPILLFSIPFLYDPIVYFQGILGVHITRGHDLAPIFALLSWPFNSTTADRIIRIILTVIIVLVWLTIIIIAYIKEIDIYSGIFYSFVAFNSLYWVFLIQYTAWIYTFYVIHTSKSKLKHWQLTSISSFIIIISTTLMGLMGLFIKNGL
ncbi:MAG: DUF2029 domain-containing protein [Candidatus Heimdallarchaeota archaeon]|nr:DUF2029 domain-containing protein [Candidatus Heimdallarchaeota archaeon]